MTPFQIQPINIVGKGFAELEAFERHRAKEMQNAQDGLARRREQKLLNAVGKHLNKETLAIEDIISLKGRMRCEVNKADQSESFYLDDTLLVTFLQPEFIVDGSAIMVKQGYGPVGV